LLATVFGVHLFQTIPRRFRRL